MLLIPIDRDYVLASDLWRVSKLELSVPNGLPIGIYCFTIHYNEEHALVILLENQ